MLQYLELAYIFTECFALHDIGQRVFEHAGLLFENLHAKGNTIIMVTHEEDIAKYAHRIVRLRDGLVETDEINQDVTSHAKINAAQ